MGPRPDGQAKPTQRFRSGGYPGPAIGVSHPRRCAPLERLRDLDRRRPSPHGAPPIAKALECPVFEDCLESSMRAYAVAVIRETRFGPEIMEYLQRIDGTLAPFSGRFRIHGGPYEPVEGAWSGDLVVIEFPSMEQARGWYESDAYQAIRPLRAGHTEGDLLLVQGVPDDHKGVDLLG